MKAFLEFVSIVRLAFALYKRLGYERAKRRLVLVLKHEDDEETEKLIKEILNEE